MQDDTTTETVQLSDGTSISVTDDAAESSIIVTGATVSQSQKENLGDYENVEPHVSVRTEFHPAMRLDSLDAVDAVTAKLAKLRTKVNDHIQDSIDHAKSGRRMD